MKKQIPRLTTDEDAERFVESADLSEYDLSEFKTVTFEFQEKAAARAGAAAGCRQATCEG